MFPEKIKINELSLYLKPCFVGLENVLGYGVLDPFRIK